MKSNVLAIDIGGSKLMLGIIDPKGKILEKDHKVISKNMNIEELINIISERATVLLSKYPDVTSAGIAIPGLTDSKNGIWKFSCFSGIKDFPIADVMSGKIKKDVFIENDVNICAIGEKVFGNCRDANDFIWITVSNGIGGGIILGGEVYQGAYGFSGEIGHIVVEENNGRLCPCGNRGCLEAQAAGPAISDVFYQLSGTKGVSAKEIAVKARQGDKNALTAYQTAGRYLGKAIAPAVNMLNPQKIIFGGGVSMDADLFLPAARDTVNCLIFKKANENLVMEKTSLGYDAALIGAGALVHCKRNKEEI